MKSLLPNRLLLNGLLLSCALSLSACSSSDDDNDFDSATNVVGEGGAQTDSSDSSNAVTDSMTGQTDTGANQVDTTDTSTPNTNTPNTTDTNAQDTSTPDTNGPDTNTPDTSAPDTNAPDTNTPDTSTPEPVAQVPQTRASCQAVSSTELINTGGVVSATLPADLSANGTQIVLTGDSTNFFSAFDPSTGAVQFTPDQSRLANVVEYQTMDATGAVLSTHTHRWVYQPVRIMPLGDSITSGVEFFDGFTDAPAMATRVGYRQRLYDQLTANGYLVDFQGQGGQAAGADAGLVDPENNGFPGVDIDFINSKLVELLAEDKVDIILLHIGTNNTPANAQGIDNILDTLDAWEATNQPVLAMVATIVPKRDAGANMLVDQFNEDLKVRVAARMNDNIVLVDQNAAVDVSDISTEQIGLHPNAEGYSKMATAWFDALTAESAEALHRCN